jgi:hypothetical protein
MTTNEALAVCYWHIGHGTRPTVAGTIALMTMLEQLLRKSLDAELQQQATEDRVTSALDTLAVWRERAERAESENRKLRDAWPTNDSRQTCICETIAGRFFTWNDLRQFYDTRDQAINAAAGITAADETEGK